MKKFLVTITFEDPYPKKYNYRTEGNTIAVGVARALRVFRQDTKGKRIKSGNIRFDCYASVNPKVKGQDD